MDRRRPGTTTGCSVALPPPEGAPSPTALLARTATRCAAPLARPPTTHQRAAAPVALQLRAAPVAVLVTVAV